MHAFRRAHQRLPWLWPYGWLGALIAVALWPAWSATDRLIVGGDALNNYYPWYAFWRDRIGAGEFPLWNPYTFSGSPAFATPHAAYGYPVNWVLTPLPAIAAINWFVGLHIMLAGLGTAWCAGKLGATKDGQFLAGVVFALGGAMAARLEAGHIYFIAGMGWLPIATGLAVTMDERHRVPALAAVVGLLATSSQPELLIFAGWWLPVWTAGMSWRHGRRRVAATVVRTLLAFGLGIGLAAFFLFPVAEYQSMSNRINSLSWEFRTELSVPFWHLLTAVNPDVFGSPLDGSYWPDVAFAWHEYLLYAGLIPLVVALRARGPAAWMCLVTLVLTLALALGRHLPLFGLIDFLPGYDLFRNPAKHLVLAALALALAAGVGMRRVSRRVLVTTGLGGGLLLISGAFTAGTWLPALIDVLGGTDVPVNEGIEAASGSARDPLLISAGLLLGLAAITRLPGAWPKRGVIALAVLELALVLQPYWIEYADPGAIEQRALSYGGDPSRGEPEAGLVGDAAVLANYGPAVEVRQPGGYTSQFSAGYMELIAGYVNPSVVLNVEPGDERLLYLLGYPAVREVGSERVTVFDPPPPRAWVSGCTWPGGATEARDPAFPLTSCVTHPDAPAQDAVVPPGVAEVLDEGTGNMTLRAQGPGWLVTTIPWYPGWTAEVDGRGTDVEVLDGALVGVQLPPGDHVVALGYWPAGLTLGLIVTGLSALVVLGLVVAEVSGDPWTRLGLEATDRVVADERNEHGEQDAPEHDRREAGPA